MQEPLGGHTQCVTRDTGILRSASLHVLGVAPYSSPRDLRYYLFAQLINYCLAVEKLTMQWYHSSRIASLATKKKIQCNQILKLVPQNGDRPGELGKLGLAVDVADGEESYSVGIPPATSLTLLNRFSVQTDFCPQLMPEYNKRSAAKWILPIKILN